MQSNGKMRVAKESKQVALNHGILKEIEKCALFEG